MITNGDRDQSEDEEMETSAKQPGFFSFEERVVSTVRPMIPDYFLGGGGESSTHFVFPHRTNLSNPFEMLLYCLLP